MIKRPHLSSLVFLVILRLKVDWLNLVVLIFMLSK